jgi:hypothetical protein
VTTLHNHGILAAGFHSGRFLRDPTDRVPENGATERFFVLLAYEAE